MFSLPRPTSSKRCEKKIFVSKLFVCVAVDYFLLGSNLDATGAISGLDVLSWCACCRVAALLF